MTLKALAVFGRQFFFWSTHIPLSKNVRENSFLNILPILINRCSSYAAASNPHILDNVEIQKYLDFVTNNQSNNKNLPGLNENQIKNLIALLEKKKNVEEEMKNLSEMSTDGDKDLEKLIEEDKQTYLNTLTQIKNEILDNILELQDQEDNRSVQIQIIPAIGGAEAELFGNELFSMYLNYINYKNWECTYDTKCRNILVKGDFVFKYLKHEAGVHRVQRVPATEKHNRTHTSTCSIAVIPQPKSDEVVINPKDLVMDTMRSSGPGGQNVQKNETCVRITHIPTGIVVESQTSRFQYENKLIAIEKLRSILYNMENDRICSEKNSLRKKQIGNNEYSDKIRTYHYIQNRVTDHRINCSMSNLQGFLTGAKELDQMIEKLREANKTNELLGYIEKFLQSVEYKANEKSKVSAGRSK